MVTLRVYDAAARNKKFADYLDRYSLYVPVPKRFVKDFGYRGAFLGFSFHGDETHGHITRCCWDEAKNGLYSVNLGRKVKRETLPTYVQAWVNEMEKVWNKATTEDTEDAWEAWNKI